MIRHCACGAMFAPHNPHQHECDACELAYMRAERAMIDAMEEIEVASAESDAFLTEWSERDERHGRQSREGSGVERGSAEHQRAA